MTKVVLLGGIYGSGKSTTVRSIKNSSENPYNTAIVDYDTFIGNDSGKIVNAEHSEELRKMAWNELFILKIRNQIEEEKELVLVPGTFSTRERRERFIHSFDQLAEVFSLYFMLPMRETVARIQTNRADETHLVNSKRYKNYYCEYNRKFAKDDNSDLLLPYDRSILAPEYRALLTKDLGNREIFETPHLDRERRHPWVVLAQPLDAKSFLTILKDGLKCPTDVRDALGYGELKGETTVEIRRQIPGFYK